MATRLLVQQPVQINTNENIVSAWLAICNGVHRWLMDFPHELRVMQEKLMKSTFIQHSCYLLVARLVSGLAASHAVFWFWISSSNMIALLRRLYTRQCVCFSFLLTFWNRAWYTHNNHGSVPIRELKLLVPYVIIVTLRIITGRERSIQERELEMPFAKYLCFSALAIVMETEGEHLLLTEILAKPCTRNHIHANKRVSLLIRALTSTGFS